MYVTADYHKVGVKIIPRKFQHFLEAGMLGLKKRIACF